MSKLFNVKFSFSVPENTDFDEFLSNLADAVDVMLGDSKVTYCFSAYAKDDNKEEQDEEK